MKKSESILLIVTVGLGVVFAASQLPGKGRVESGQALGAGKSGPGSRAVTSRRAVALELLVAGRVPLKPLPPTLRNPFRPVSERAGHDEVEIAIRVTAIFGDREGGDERLSALVRGTVVQGEDEAGAIVVPIKRTEAGLAELLAGKRVRQGDSIGALQVVYVGQRGVVLLYRGQRIPVKLYSQGGEGVGGEHAGSERSRSDTSSTQPTGGTHPPGTDTENPLRAD